MTALQTALVFRHNSNGSSRFPGNYYTRNYTSNVTPLLKSPCQLVEIGKKNIFVMTNTTASSAATTAAYKDNHLHEGRFGETQTIITSPQAPSDHLKHLHGSGGIGVLEFLQGKNYLVTGATGFLAKVLIEKLLRRTPDVGKIYVLIRANDNQAAAERLKTDIVDSELFMSLESLHGEYYKTFMLNKLIPVAGDVCKPDLGIESNFAAEMAQVVDVVVNSSANTTFDERYDVAINTNTRGPCRVLGFAKRCKNLCLFLHVSTAYVNGDSGIISETPIQMGQGMKSQVYPDEVDIEAELKISLQSEEAFQVKSTPMMKELDLQRSSPFLHVLGPDFRSGWSAVKLLSRGLCKTKPEGVVTRGNSGVRIRNELF
ncbi:fatty acyl-CoA reductase 2, chloroplastic-like [Apium graveolens]|uniref:fatty acyl-CoA reductase 2, chloroplastic-like n=1 Tax=Apium graveolens TaxID=4045 RepID=UPI003D7ADE7C